MRRMADFLISYIHMDLSSLVILFIFGIAIGSFLNVVILRYDGEHFLLDATMIGGRSHCMHCKQTLRWFELVPVFSFFCRAGDAVGARRG